VILKLVLPVGKNKKFLGGTPDSIKALVLAYLSALMEFQCLPLG